MTLQEFYTTIGGDYEGAMKRLRTDKLAVRLIGKFPEDGSFALLQAAVAEGSQEDIFRAAHTLKGLALNLGFTRLGNSSSELTEATRHELAGDVPTLYAAVERDYRETLDAVTALLQA